MFHDLGPDTTKDCGTIFVGSDEWKVKVTASRRSKMTASGSDASGQHIAVRYDGSSWCCHYNANRV